jgi:hypothetical protein
MNSSKLNKALSAAVSDRGRVKRVSSSQLRELAKAKGADMTITKTNAGDSSALSSFSPSTQRGKAKSLTPNSEKKKKKDLLLKSKEKKTTPGGAKRGFKFVKLRSSRL